MNAQLRPGIDGLLARLERVQKTGNGWRANCPNGHKSRGSLSITQADDGRVLLHCFAGCATADVLGALGLSVSDLMPERLAHPTPKQRDEARERFRRNGIWATAGVIEREAGVVVVAAGDVLQGRALDDADMARLIDAGQRIVQARATLTELADLHERYLKVAHRFPRWGVE
jgi:hypothetical protein